MHTHAGCVALPCPFEWGRVVWHGLRPGSLSPGLWAESGALAAPPCSHALLQVVNVTGNQDICYYNFLCAHPLGNLRWGWS